MIFARIGHGPCYYHWNEIFAGVITVGLAFTFEATSSPFEVRLAVLGAEDSSLVVADY